MLFQVLGYSPAGMTGNKHILLWQMPRPKRGASLSSETKPSRRLGAGRRVGYSWVMRLLLNEITDRKTNAAQTVYMWTFFLKKRLTSQRKQNSDCQREGRRNGGIDQRAHIFSWRKCVSSEDLIYSVMTGVDDCSPESFCACIFLFSPQRKGTELTIWSDECVHYLDLGHQSHKEYVYHIGMLCTLHTHKSILFLNKVGGKAKRQNLRRVLVPYTQEIFSHCSSWRERFQVSEQMKSQKKQFWRRECDREMKEAEWIEMNRTQGAHAGNGSGRKAGKWLHWK